jgi:Uri superfamily endonuclease
MKGTYVLLIEIKKNCKIKVGRLGEIKFKKGLYAYIGSALNSLEKRIRKNIPKCK